MFFGGVLLIFIALASFWGFYSKKVIAERNELVKVQIIEAPEDCNNIPDRGGYCTFKYDDEIFVRRAGNKFCDQVVNQKQVLMLTNEQKSTFIFQGEYKSFEILYSILLFFLGIYIMFYHKIHKVKK